MTDVVQLSSLPYVFDQPLRTERLSLRLLTESDIDDVFAYQSREDVCRYLLYEPRTRELVSERVMTYSVANTLAVDNDYLQLAIEFDARGDGSRRVVGDIYFSVTSVDNQRAEIGWTLHPDFHGRGIASEAATAVLGFAFDTLGLHRVVAELDPRNDASVALCRRLGMREEAYFVKDLLFKGDWGDTGLYAMLRSEWDARQR